MSHEYPLPSRSGPLTDEELQAYRDGRVDLLPYVNNAYRASRRDALDKLIAARLDAAESFYTPDDTPGTGNTGRLPYNDHPYGTGGPPGEGKG